MKETSLKNNQKTKQTRRKEFQFASKEGLIIVSLILFSIYAIWYKIFEFYYYGKLTWLVIFWTFSLVVFTTMAILLITGIYVFWKDRRYLILHEKLGGFIFLLGTIILLFIPISWGAGILSFQGAFGNNSILILIFGITLCTLGSLILARTGGFFIVWMIGVAIYLIRFHELFNIWVQGDFFGRFDDFVGSIGFYAVLTSFILFLYHDLKFFYLTRIIKKGNKYRKEKKYSAALRCFNTALKIYPLFTTAWNNMGNVYFNQGKPNEAVKCYQKALHFNPDYINAKRNLQVVSKRMNKA